MKHVKKIIKSSQPGILPRLNKHKHWFEKYFRNDLMFKDASQYSSALPLRLLNYKWNIGKEAISTFKP